MWKWCVAQYNELICMRMDVFWSRLHCRTRRGVVGMLEVINKHSTLTNVACVGLALLFMTYIIGLPWRFGASRTQPAWEGARGDPTAATEFCER
jgi:hypothetical protein